MPSRIAGPTGKNPFAMAPRTPGPLGINDAASPDAPDALLGDTPGSLGVNDHAEALANPGRGEAVLPPDADDEWGDFLDSVCDWNTLSVPGPQMAFDPPGHWNLSQTSATPDFLNSFKDFLPPGKETVRKRLLEVLRELPSTVVLTDVTPDQFSDKPVLREVLSPTGQATHFMANQGQNQWEAYLAARAKISDGVERAISAFSGAVVGREQGEGVSLNVSRPLGNAIHTLQDSFSETHVQREPRGKQSIIVKIFSWEEQKKAKVDHDAGDKKWRNDDGTLTEAGQDAVDATKMLLAYFVLSVVGKRREAAEKKFDLIDSYLVASGEVAAAQSKAQK